ncbi:hypothetical protein MMC28_011450 [Mycoblastus sanguinarius]|nr:hypothetical protein [Mycoblastus sanguinarius]
MAAFMGMEPETLRLKRGQQVLENRLTMEHYEIRHGSSLDLVNVTDIPNTTRIQHPDTDLECANSVESRVHFSIKGEERSAGGLKQGRQYQERAVKGLRRNGQLQKEMQRGKRGAKEGLRQIWGGAGAPNTSLVSK